MAKKPVTKYPMECAAVVRQETFAITNALARAKIEDGDEPLSIYAPFSRFIFAIINEAKQSVTANIPVRCIANIEHRSSLAEQKDFMDSFNKVDQANLAPAYTVKISSGVLKGRTPAEVLLENPDNKNLLNNQYAWLQKNLDKYPQNKTQMDAIQSAAQLMKDGLLRKENIQGTAPIVIYQADIRPLMSRKRQDGKTFVYGICIKWHIGDDYPVEIRIENYYAPVLTKDDGTVNVQIKQAADKQVNTMMLSVEEWNRCLSVMRSNMNMFEILNASACYKEALSASQEQRNQAQSQAS